MSVEPWLLRNRVEALCRRDPVTALSIARTIANPWYSGQALAFVGRYWIGADFVAILDESAAASRVSDDPYVPAALSAWPVRALLERGALERADALLKAALSDAARIPNKGSQSDALFLLFQVVQPYGRTLWQPVVEAMIANTREVLAWRQRRNLCDMILILADDAGAFADALRATVRDEELQKRMEKALRSGRPLAPRPFFWTPAA